MIPCVDECLLVIGMPPPDVAIEPYQASIDLNTIRNAVIRRLALVGDAEMWRRMLVRENLYLQTVEERNLSFVQSPPTLVVNNRPLADGLR